jgi:alkane 1-monooxygenase
MGIVIGTCGINVAHELGHRKSIVERILAQILLIPAFYIHFFIEHNRGHHKYVATKLDPASAEKGEVLYSFWWKSVIGGYFNAWKLEDKRLKKHPIKIKFYANKMVLFSFAQLIYLILLVFFFSWSTVFATIFAGITGILLLETINYLEHYGLRRQILDTNKYERVQPKHSWNANYHFGRIVLYELTRHSDHHYLASKKYQILDHHESSPQLPFGYPMMMLIAFIPPLWFKIVDPIIPQN